MSLSPPERHQLRNLLEFIRVAATDGVKRMDGDPHETTVAGLLEDIRADVERAVTLAAKDPGL